MMDRFSVIMHVSPTLFLYFYEYSYVIILNKAKYIVEYQLYQRKKYAFIKTSKCLNNNTTCQTY